MLTLLERCFPEHTDRWRPKIAEAIPSYGRRLSDDAALSEQVRTETARTLQLTA